MRATQLIDLFQRARGDKDLAVIEGVQALKHAVRFKAEIYQYITCDINYLKHLLEELAEDIMDDILPKFTEVSSEVFNKLSPNPHRTKVMALAKRRSYRLSEVSDTGKIVVLEEPKDLENIGAVIRVSAGANAGAVVISGNIDIWHPAVIRGGAGLHWAIPVFTSSLEKLIEQCGKRVKICLDPYGKDIGKVEIPKDAILIFGTERHGVSEKSLGLADNTVSLPMKSGVSSLNLATSVAATLYQL